MKYPRCLVLVTGDDQRGSLKDILGILKSVWIEVIWVRSFGRSGGAILLMVRGDKKVDDEVAEEETNKLCAKLQIFFEPIQGKYHRLSPLLLPVDQDYKPEWEWNQKHLIFSFQHLVDSGDVQMSAMKAIAGIPGLNIVQHDSSISPGAQFYISTFRAYSDLALDHTAEDAMPKLRKTIEQALRASIGGEGIRKSLKFRVPTPDRLSLLNPYWGLQHIQNSKSGYLYVRAIVKDVSSIYSRMFMSISQATSCPIVRSCCRGLGGVGLLCFAIADSVDAQENLRNLLLEEYKDELFDVDDDGVALSVRHDDKSPYKFAGEGFKSALVSKVGFHEDAKGLAYEVIRCLTEDGSNTYLMDGMPRPSDNKRFAIRAGTLYLEPADAKRAAAYASMALLLDDTISCDNVEIDLMD